MLTWIQHWLWPKPKLHSGKCDKCDKQFVIWLDRSGLYCWDHYIEVTAKHRIDGP